MMRDVLCGCARLLRHDVTARGSHCECASSIGDLRTKSSWIVDCGIAGLRVCIRPSSVLLARRATEKENDAL